MGPADRPAARRPLRRPHVPRAEAGLPRRDAPGRLERRRGGLPRLRLDAGRGARRAVRRVARRDARARRRPARGRRRSRDRWRRSSTSPRRRRSRRVTHPIPEAALHQAEPALAAWLAAALGAEVPAAPDPAANEPAYAAILEGMDEEVNATLLAASDPNGAGEARAGRRRDTWRQCAPIRHRPWPRSACWCSPRNRWSAVTRRHSSSCSRTSPRSSPKSWRGHYLLGELRRLTGNASGAVVAFEHADALHPLRDADSIRLAELYVDAGAESDRTLAPPADQAGQRRLRARAGRVLGVLAAQRGDLAGAHAAFERAVSSGTRDGAIFARLAQVQTAQGDTAGATATFERAAGHADPSWELSAAHAAWLHGNGRPRARGGPLPRSRRERITGRHPARPRPRARRIRGSAMPRQPSSTVSSATSASARSPRTAGGFSSAFGGVISKSGWRRPAARRCAAPEDGRRRRGPMPKRSSPRSPTSGRRTSRSASSRAARAMRGAAETHFSARARALARSAGRAARARRRAPHGRADGRCAEDARPGGRLRPEDAGYLADAGFAQLRAGNLNAARERLTLASELDADDPITQAYLQELARVETAGRPN